MKPAKILLPLVLATALTGCAALRSTDIENIEDKDKTAEQFYQQAQAAARQGNWETAIERLETLQSRFPFGAEADQAALDIIYMHFQAEDWDAVIASADRFIRLNPTHPRVDYAYYMRGSASMERGRGFVERFIDTNRALRDPQPLMQAFGDFKRILANYPDSPYAEDARHRITVLRNQLAKHEVEVARFYLERSAYVAAANRAKGVIETYQGSPSVKDALEILTVAYDRLELDQLKQDILRVIQLNYPDHPLAKQAG